MNDPLYVRDACPRHPPHRWAGPIYASCGHHRRCLELLVEALGGRLVTAAGANARCGVVDGDGARCPCLADWISLTAGQVAAVDERCGASLRWDPVLGGIARRAAVEGRDPVEIAALLLELRADSVYGGASWTASWRTLEHAGGALARLRAGRHPRLALTARARSVGRKLAGVT